VVPAITQTGFDPARAAASSRYGLGTYFSDESCKAHQYAKKFKAGDEYTMLYCRVIPGRALPFKVCEASADRGYLQGMAKPAPSDPVFVRQMKAAGWTARGRQEWDSVDVLGVGKRQYHRELIIYEREQVYPEFVVTYRLDTKQEQREKEQKRKAGTKAPFAGAKWLLGKGWEAAVVATWLLEARSIVGKNCARWLLQQDGWNAGDVASWLQEEANWTGDVLPNWLLQQDGWAAGDVAAWLQHEGGWEAESVATWIGTLSASGWTRAADWLLQQEGWGSADAVAAWLGNQIWLEAAANWLMSRNPSAPTHAASLIFRPKDGCFRGGDVSRAACWLLPHVGNDALTVARWIQSITERDGAMAARWLLEFMRWSPHQVVHLWLRPATNMRSKEIAAWMVRHHCDPSAVLDWLGTAKGSDVAATWGVAQGFGIVNITRWLLEKASWPERDVGRFIGTAFGGLASDARASGSNKRPRHRDDDDVLLVSPMAPGWAAEV